MSTKPSAETVTLPAAGARLAMTWGQVYNALLSGKLEGWLEGSRYRVTVASVERLLRERQAQDRTPAAI